MEREKAITINRELSLIDYVNRFLRSLRLQANCASSELVPYFENVKAINQESTNYTTIIVKLSSTNLKNGTVHCSRIYF